MAGPREIPQRELRNSVSDVLRQVEAGASLRVTVRGRPVADLVPVAARDIGLQFDRTVFGGLCPLIGSPALRPTTTT
jgi:prevent-host-death family protein